MVKTQLSINRKDRKFRDVVTIPFFRRRLPSTFPAVRFAFLPHRGHFKHLLMELSNRNWGVNSNLL
jgi:hypothetical protein